jgi:uncharacterized protein
MTDAGLEMPGIRVGWDEVKNRLNQTKHGISFQEAAYVFLDPLLVMVQDRFEDGEERWQSIGMIEGVLLLLVAHTVYEDIGTEGEMLEVFHIISARPVTKAERVRYESENR